MEPVLTKRKTIDVTVKLQEDTYSNCPHNNAFAPKADQSPCLLSSQVTHGIP